jgi:peptidoglycan/xylan/chitin deacetylase (PgdA/CDA1 family)
MQILYKAFSATRADEIIWSVDKRRLRILCYHGVCDDALINQPWVPDFFVSRSAFEQQMAYLSTHANVLSMFEAVLRLRNRSLPPNAVVLTFDDGYANNLHAALPVLERYGMPATIFVSTAYTESGELYHFLKLKLIRMYAGLASLDLQSRPLPDHKKSPVSVIVEQIESHWERLRPLLTREQTEILRPLTIPEIASVDSPLIEFGAHTHMHCILSRESDERRREEIQRSVGLIDAWTRRAIPVFSYPNGQTGDFGEPDKAILREVGIQAAVSGVSGANDADSPLLELSRYPVGRYHDEAGFRAEVTGFRSLLLSLTRRAVA